MAKTEKRKDIAGSLIPAGLFIGMGVGLIVDSFLPGLFLGLGVGFIAYAIVKMMKKK